MKLFIVFYLLLAFTSCKQSEKSSRETTTMQEVIAIHDEIMPKMNELAQLTAQLKAKVDTTAQGQRYQAAMKELQAAHTAMMDWMQGFGDRFDHEEIMKGKALSDQKKEWLIEEEVKVKKLRKQFLSSIKGAQELLSEN